ncbi:MAG: TPM domain-containing protein [Bryobacteraceae bacterium]|nr:TPM domain-containing protein [Bryobacteraceae bacterium]
MRALLTALCVAASLGAADWSALKPTGYVNDFAKVLDAASLARMNAYCERVEKATGAQIAVVTIDTLDGEPVEDVANLLYRQWGIGKKGKDEGALFLLAVRDRRSRLEVGYGLEGVLPDGFAGSVLREMRPALRQRDYATALGTAIVTISERIAKDKGVSLADAPPVKRTRKHSEGSPWPFLGLAMAIILFSVIGGSRRGMRSRGVPGMRGSDVLTGMILGSILNGGRGGRSSGGFGGYDSGGGFGGFGGGDSGGGGASGDW